MWRDLKYGFRQLRTKKLFAVTVILLLALGIGSNTVIFSFVNSLLLRSLPVRAPENLYLLEKNRVRQVRPDTSFFYQQFEEVAARKTIFSGAVAEEGWAGNSLQAFSNGTAVRLIATQMVSPNYFAELGVKAVAGRVLTAADATASSNIPVVLSYRFWRSEFDGSLAILHRTIRVRNYPFLVVGVLPNGFHGIDADRSPDVRFPISAALPLTGNSLFEPGGDYPLGFRILTRLAPGISERQSAAAIQAELDGLEEPLWRAWYARSSKPFPPSRLKENIDYQRAYRIDLLAAGHGVSELRKQFSHAAVVLMGAVGLLLLAVCANVAGLLLARSEERHGEIAIRLSLGAGRGRILRQFALENVLLAIPGALLGLAFAYGSSPWLLRLLPALGIGPYAPPVVLDVRPDGRVLLFVLVTCFLTIVLFGLAPVRRVLKVDLNERLKAQSRTVTAGSGNTIAAIQTALAVLLLTGATLMYRTFWNLEHVNPGFDRAHVVEFTIDPWDVGYSETQAATLIRELNGRVRALPGVRAVSFAVGEMMRGIGMKSTVVPAGQMLPANTFLNTSFNRVTSGYFESLGIPLVAGRALSAGDAGRKPTPIVVNRAFAAAFFPGINPIGQMIVAGVDGRKAPTAIIVGVVGTAKYRSLREQDPPIYYAAADEEHAGGTMYVRSYGDPAGLIRSVRRVLSRLAPGLPLVHALTLEQDVQDSLWQERFLTVLGAFFGLAALSLSAIGLYGNLAYSVARRSKELGIRIALGAQVRDIVRSVSGRIVWAIAIGLLAGAGAATFLLRFAGGLVFGIDPLDPVSFAAAAMVLIVCSVIAAIPPSWRAVQTDAAVALRQE